MEFKEEEVHIIPCDTDGNLLKKHEIEVTCACHPSVKIIEVSGEYRVLVSHNMIQ